MLTFFGRGGGFSDQHNGAFFRIGGKLIMLDCPMIAFTRMKNEIRDIDEIIVAVTHTHSDHIAGLALTIHLATFVLDIKVTVIAPSEEVKTDLRYLIERLDGCYPKTYRLLTADEYIKEDQTWMKAAIPTDHVPLLVGRCFGYNLEIDGKNVVYTGDTNTLEPYIPYLTPGSVFYSECTLYETDVHINIDKLLEYKDFFRKNDIKVYMMHLDNIDEIIKKTEGTGFEVVPLL